MIYYNGICLLGRKNLYYSIRSFDLQRWDSKSFTQWNERFLFASNRTYVNKNNLLSLSLPTYVSIRFLFCNNIKQALDSVRNRCLAKYALLSGMYIEVLFRPDSAIRRQSPSQRCKKAQETSTKSCFSVKISCFLSYLAWLSQSVRGFCIWNIFWPINCFFGSRGWMAHFSPASFFSSLGAVSGELSSHWQKLLDRRCGY